LDGVISSGEYGAGVGPIQVESMTTTIFASNDAGNLYLAVRIVDGTADPADLLVFFFDNEHDGDIRDCGSPPGEDGVGVRGVPPGEFIDLNYCGPTLVGSFDIISDGHAIRSTAEGVESIYELSHPLASGDGEDFTVSTGQTVGWCLVYINDGMDFTEPYPPDCFGDASNYGDIVVQAPPPPPTPPPRTAVGGEIEIVNSGRSLSMGLVLSVVTAVSIALGFRVAENRIRRRRRAQCKSSSSSRLRSDSEWLQAEYAGDDARAVQILSRVVCSSSPQVLVPQCGRSWFWLRRLRV